MHDLRYYRVMADYNYWMNIKIYSVCAEIPDSQRRQDQGAFFKSIHESLNHILATDRLWLARFAQQPLPGRDDNRFEDFETLRREREQTDQQIQQWAENLSVEWLKQPFSFESRVDGQIRTLPAWVLAVHLFNHQTHHRGQITTLLHQLGYDYGVTDLPWLPSLQASE